MEVSIIFPVGEESLAVEFSASLAVGFSAGAVVLVGFVVLLHDGWVVFICFAIVVCDFVQLVDAIVAGYAAFTPPVLGKPLADEGTDIFDTG